MRIILGITLGLASAAAYADMDCNKGLPWRLPLAPPGFDTVESSIKIEGNKGQLIAVCNCTADVAGKNTGVWVRASSEINATRSSSPPRNPRAAAGGGTNAYYLPAKSCTFVGSSTVILGPTDAVETWGYFQVQP